MTVAIVRTVETTGGGLQYVVERRVQVMHVGVDYLLGCELSVRRRPVMCPEMISDRPAAIGPKLFPLSQVLAYEPLP
jgi:hypothetical protein